MMKPLSNRPLPTQAQQEWADMELGVLIHYDIPVFSPDFDFRKRWGDPLDVSIFNPTMLDTDQWLSTAAAAGAKYAVLVAKHCSGFSLWPTEAHDYSVKSAPWRDGKGDIVGDFIKSCKKFGIKPGLYYSVACNGYFCVDNPGTVLSGNEDEQKAYNEMVIKQVTELWTKYGELFEIWFDGGALPPEKGGPDVLSLLLKYQPNAVCFQGPEQFPSILRWVGNESGLAPNPCWSTTNAADGDFIGTEQMPEIGVGDPDGRVWAPAETDMPNRYLLSNGGGWFWRAGEDDLLFEPEELLERYYTSVGSNSNLLIGMVIDDRGLVPDADVEQFAAFGQLIKDRFGKPIAKAGGEGTEIAFYFARPSVINHVVIMENIARGERIRAYTVEAEVNGVFQPVCSGFSVGHKRIERFDDVEVTGVKLKITDSTDVPDIRQFAVYKI